MKRILQSCMLVAMTLLVTRGEAQRRTVSGTVTSQDGNKPLAGVSVLIEGTTTGATTDISGKYSLTVPSGTYQLVFTHQGYISQTVPASSGSVDIRLAPDVKQLADVVVTALGIKRSEKSLTYSTQVINGSSLDVAKETNVVNSLQGKVSGVVISRSATGPGGSSKVLLRGNRSITGGNEPLYIIDGVPMNTDKRSSGGTSFGGRDGGGASQW